MRPRDGWMGRGGGMVSGDEVVRGSMRGRKEAEGGGIGVVGWGGEEW